MSLKVQTSKSNYLTTLSVRIEQVEFSDEASWDDRSPFSRSVQQCETRTVVLLRTMNRIVSITPFSRSC
ncbi:hypothetical protein EV363DRAFT_1156178 [Boletus edulis]|nr:hypothetical protein EV363DRAFT_1156178 [Boletus edulis]